MESIFYWVSLINVLGLRFHLFRCRFGNSLNLGCLIDHVGLVGCNWRTLVWLLARRQCRKHCAQDVIKAVHLIKTDGNYWFRWIIVSMYGIPYCCNSSWTFRHQKHELLSRNQKLVNQSKRIGRQPFCLDSSCKKCKQPFQRRSKTTNH